ncbi:hypothetical protein [Vandammella animalimorsus]|uniref:hypothetical protein n=1 Tax=Vandammella animalimorsus TaxID=2029117 RepID=UPI00117D63ED|nr:hypothetical protein [Vandammella animalimorsus]
MQINDKTSNTETPKNTTQLPAIHSKTYKTSQKLSPSIFSSHRPDSDRKNLETPVTAGISFIHSMAINADSLKHSL